MEKYEKLKEIRKEVMDMSDAECLLKYKRDRTEYLKELDYEYWEWQDHFESMFI